MPIVVLNELTMTTRIGASAMIANRMSRACTATAEPRSLGRMCGRLGEEVVMALVLELVGLDAALEHDEVGRRRDQDDEEDHRGDGRPEVEVGHLAARTEEGAIKQRAED